MAKNRYYTYDHEACAFVELKDRMRRLRIQVAAIASLAIVLALVLTWGIDHYVETPQELSLKAENAVLQAQLSDVIERMEQASVRLEQLAETDQELYRSLLEAEPISNDVRQLGVGGADPYAEFDRYSPSAASLLRTSSRQLDRLERQMNLQRDSYRELGLLAGQHALQLEELPAILPTSGPVVSGYGLRYHPILKIRRMHYGVDIQVSRGTPVVTAGDGVVQEVGRGNGFGNYVKVEHADAGYVTLYAHLSKFADGLRKGREVKRGEVIAFSGNSGLSKAPHLHYEVHDLTGRALNPVYFFAPSMTPVAYQDLLRQSEQGTVSFD